MVEKTQWHASYSQQVVNKKSKPYVLSAIVIGESSWESFKLASNGMLMGWHMHMVSKVKHW